MNTEKIKHIPFNILWCIGSFLVPMCVFDMMLDVGLLPSIIISGCIYMLDVIHTTDTDYLLEKIEKHISEKHVQ